MVIRSFFFRFLKVPPDTHIPEFNGPGPGKGEEKPSRLSSCQQVIGAWAMGAKVSVDHRNLGIHVRYTNMLKGIA